MKRFTIAFLLLFVLISSVLAQSDLYIRKGVVTRSLEGRAGSVFEWNGNTNLNASLGSELAPALTTANWTTGAGWESPIVGPGLIKSGDGTGTQTPSAATTIVAGVTYKVVITLSAWSVGSATYTVGGVAGQSLAAAATYTDYITASTTGKLIITPTSTSRFTISAISIKALTNTTGDLTVDGNLTIKSPIKDGSGTDTITLLDGKAIMPITDKGGQVYNVKAYNAVGDGVTDDTAAIQAAIDAAELVGGSVFIPVGRYIVSGTLYVNYGIELYGVGKYSILQRNSDAVLLQLDSDTALDVFNYPQVHDISLLGIGDYSETTALMFINKVSIGKFTNIRLWRSGGHGIHLKDSQECFFDTILFDRCGTLANGGSGIYIDHDITLAWIVGVNKCVFSNLNFLGFQTGAGPMIESNNAGGNTEYNLIMFDHCQFEGSGESSAFFVLRDIINSLFTDCSYAGYDGTIGYAFDLDNIHGLSISGICYNNILPNAVVLIGDNVSLLDLYLTGPYLKGRSFVFDTGKGAGCWGIKDHTPKSTSETNPLFINDFGVGIPKSAFDLHATGGTTVIDATSINHIVIKSALGDYGVLAQFQMRSFGADVGVRLRFRLRSDVGTQTVNIYANPGAVYVTQLTVTTTWDEYKVSLPYSVLTGLVDYATTGNFYLAAGTATPNPVYLDYVIVEGIFYDGKSPSGDFTVEGTSAVINQDTTSDATPTFSKMGLGMSPVTNKLEVAFASDTVFDGINIRNTGLVSALSPLDRELGFTTYQAGANAARIGKIAGYIPAYTSGVNYNGLKFSVSSGDVVSTAMVIRESGNVGIGFTRPPTKLAVLGDVTIANPATLGSEALTNPNLTAGTSWSAANECTLAADAATWAYVAGGASTLTQAAGTMVAGKSKPNELYKFTYTVTAVSGYPLATITTSFASASARLDIVNGTYTIYLRSAAVPSDFVITCTLAAGQAFTLDTFSLKEVTGGDLVLGGKITGGGAKGMTIDGADNVAVGNAALATDATDGFLYIPGGNGVPTGTPTSKTGLYPMYFDYANNDLYLYNSGWQKMSP